MEKMYWYGGKGGLLQGTTTLMFKHTCFLKNCVLTTKPLLITLMNIAGAWQGELTVEDALSCKLGFVFEIGVSRGPLWRRYISATVGRRMEASVDSPFYLLVRGERRIAIVTSAWRLDTGLAVGHNALQIG